MMKRTCYLCKTRVPEPLHVVTINERTGWTPTKRLVCHHCYTNSRRVVK